MTEQRITSRKNPLLQQVKKLLSSRKAREEAGLFAADGVKLLAEAVRWYPGLDTVILSDGVHADVPESVRLFRVPEDVMASISPMESPQGALFLCRLPEKLRQTAQLRLAYPELSLAQLAERCDPPVTKSCMNHRMRKLLEKAREQK